MLWFLDSTRVALNDLQFKIILIYLLLALGAGPLFVLSETIDLIGGPSQTEGLSSMWLGLLHSHSDSCVPVQSSCMKTVFQPFIGPLKHLVSAPLMSPSWLASAKAIYKCHLISRFQSHSTRQYPLHLHFPLRHWVYIHANGPQQMFH